MTPRMTELENDAVVEVFNVGVGRAAASLSRMVSEHIEMSIPEVEIVPKADVIDLLKKDVDGIVVSISQAMSGDLTGDAVLLFTQKSSMALVRTLLKQEANFASLNQLEKDALQEIGNIILNACVGTITNMLRLSVTIEIPEIQIGPLKSVMDLDDEGEWAVSMQVKLGLQQSKLSGCVTFLMDLDAVTCLTEGVGNYISKLTSAH